MQKISADYIFPITDEPIKNGIIILDNNRSVIDVINPAQIDYEISDVKRYNGFICPGFINTHCHLELSHLKGKIPEKTGVASFISKVQKLRKADRKNIIEEKIIEAEKEMIAHGIVAVGDIMNSNLTLKHKAKSKIRYYNFIESIGLNEIVASYSFIQANILFEKIKNLPLNNFASVVPHSPYAVSRKFFTRIRKFAIKHNFILTMHNQESDEENKLFKNRSGKIYRQLLSFGVDMAEWKATGKSSLSSVLSFLPKKTKIILVHNTFTSKEDIELAEGFFKKLFWCFCPNSNLYIEGILPNIPQFIEKKCKITLGTDSLASNHSLSILSEIQTILRYFPKLSFNEVLCWATLNGAEALGFDKQFGSLEKSKKPGIILIENINVKICTLTDKSKVKLLNC